MGSCALSKGAKDLRYVDAVHREQLSVTFSYVLRMPGSRPDDKRYEARSRHCWVAQALDIHFPKQSVQWAKAKAMRFVLASHETMMYGMR